jgi:hypothetical protein
MAPQHERIGRQLVQKLRPGWVLAWLVPAVLVWLAITPFYNRFLTVSALNLLHLTESPNVSRLLPKEDANYVVVSRADFPPSRPNLYQIRVTDIHFNLIVLAALFLATQVPWRTRLGNLGWAVVIAIFFHMLLLFLWVKFVYATQLGEWSTQNYGEVGYNLFGMAKHLLDLPFKLALPLILWAGFYLRTLLPQRTES